VREAIKLAVVARKGGVGRTPICQNLAGACADRNAKVLLIDQDPQGSLSKNFFGKDVVNGLDASQTAAAIYDGAFRPELVIHETPIPGISIVPSSDYMQKYDFLPADDCEHLFALRKFVAAVEHDYNIVVIDTPPNAGNLPVVASWVACDYSLTVIQPTKNAIEAIADIKSRIAKVIVSTNPSLYDLGCLLTNVKKNTVQRLLEKTVRQIYGDNVFRTVIPSRTVFEQAICARQPVTHYKPKSDVAEAFRQVLHEIGQRITEAREITHDKVANQ